MKIKEVLDKLYSSQTFKEWNEKQKDFLAHVFVMEDQYQVGYYNKDTDKITTFIVGDEVQLVPEQTVFKHPGAKISPLNIENIKVNEIKIMEAVDKLKQEKYSSYQVIKKFFIVQNINNKEIYNVTLVSPTFEVLNIRVCAETGKILEEGMHNMVGGAMDGRKNSEDK